MATPHETVFRNANAGYYGFLCLLECDREAFHGS